jgi:ketosteroid isomerase-like protein
MPFGDNKPPPPPPSHRTGCLVFAILSAILACILGLMLYLDSQGRVSASAAGQQLLHDQQAAWNRGDLPGFTATYRMHDSVTVCSEGRIYKGWDQLNERYRAMYGGRAMGELRYDDVTIEALSSDSVLMRGRWTNTANGSLRTGLFTIVAKKFASPEGWKIVHDHMTISG